MLRRAQLQHSTRAVARMVRRPVCLCGGAPATSGLYSPCYNIESMYIFLTCRISVFKLRPHIARPFQSIFFNIHTNSPRMHRRCLLRNR
jgi:hypothetical protein